MATTIIEGDFEWDADKAASNLAKHDVSFEEAATALADEMALFDRDDRHEEEDRYKAVGMSVRLRVLLVVVVERGDRERIISARRATEREEQNYYAKAGEEG